MGAWWGYGDVHQMDGLCSCPSETHQICACTEMDLINNVRTQGQTETSWRFDRNKWTSALCLLSMLFLVTVNPCRVSAGNPTRTYLRTVLQPFVSTRNKRFKYLGICCRQTVRFCRLKKCFSPPVGMPHPNSRPNTFGSTKLKLKLKLKNMQPLTPFNGRHPPQ